MLRKCHTAALDPHGLGRFFVRYNQFMSVIIQRVAAEVRSRMEGEGSGHDWWHIQRVWTMAKRIGEEEGANMEVVELAALCHDIADWKFRDGDEEAGPRETRALLESMGAAEETIAAACEIVATLSFKGAGVATGMTTIEGKCVQDADRIDALGAIGIARAFAYGGHASREMHNPERAPEMHQTKEAYKTAKGTTINHFHEKLLLLKDRMNTVTGKKLAEGRHAYMEQFLAQFGAEWEGKS